MKRLVLLRHAKSSWRDSRLSDHDRPLAKRGLRDAPRMGERLSLHGARPGLVLTSSAERARATARRVLEAMESGDIPVTVEPKLYLSSPAEILGIVSLQPDRVDELLLVAHNPGLTELANELLPKLGLANLPTAGIVAVDFDCSRWSDVADCKRSLAYFDYPKNTEPVVSRTVVNP